MMGPKLIENLLIKAHQIMKAKAEEILQVHPIISMVYRGWVLPFFSENLCRNSLNELPNDLEGTFFRSYDKELRLARCII